MDPLNLHSEPFSQYGGMASDGILKLLDGANLDPLTVLIRETVQNSWDARVRNGRPVKFTVAVRELDARQVRFLREKVFADCPPEKPPIGEWLDEDSAKTVLIISDRNTQGLGGPTFADRIPDDQEQARFVKLIRNIGEPQSDELAGGSFGFGKASLFINSFCNTVLFHTRFRESRSELQTRFIGYAIGGEYQVRERRLGVSKRFTGRHWWGQQNRAGQLEPHTGTKAAYFAERVGFPEWEGQETGTSIMILGPHFGGRSASEAVEFISEVLLWYFWPKMLTSSRGRSEMKFRLFLNDKEFRIPTPEEFGCLSGFTEALRNLLVVRNPELALQPEVLPYKGAVEPISCLRPQKELGLLSMRKFIAMASSSSPAHTAGNLDDPADAPSGAAPFAGPCRHIALMRNAKLVVEYREAFGVEAVQDGLQYAGVFLPHEDTDAVFSASEPPTHDTWKSERLQGRDRTFVRVALKRIDETFRSFAAGQAGRQPSSVEGRLGPLAHFLGGLLPGFDGGGATEGDEGRTNRSGNGPAIRQPRITVLQQTLKHFADRTAVAVQFSVEHLRDTAGSLISAEAGAVVDVSGALESADDGGAPEGAEVPKIIGWRKPDSDHLIMSEKLEIISDSTAPEIWELLVSRPADCAVGIRLSSVSIGEAGTHV